jgi:hypothetical protein
MGRAHPLPRYEHNDRRHNDHRRNDREHNDHGGNGRRGNDREQTGKPSPLRRDDAGPDVQTLMEENTQLRKLVIELSKLVAKNVMTRR